MSNTSNKRIPTRVLEADRQAFLKLQTLGDYSPRNPAFSIDQIEQAMTALTEAEEAEVVAQRALEVARDRAIKAGLVAHSLMLGVKVEVTAQYGSDSETVHAVGLKQKSERRRPTRREPPAP